MKNDIRFFLLRHGLPSPHSLIFRLAALPLERFTYIIHDIKISHFYHYVSLPHQHSRHP